MITGSLLYNLVECPHRVYQDLFTDPAGRDPISKFVQLLWERGTVFEKEVITSLKILFTNLSELSLEEREHHTESAIKRGDALIYGGRIRAGDLLGEPDLLRKQGNGYVAGDIKSGAGEETIGDADDKKPKKRYAVQLALYTDILERKGISAGRNPFVWDIHGDEIVYNLDAPQGPRNPESLWDFYLTILGEGRRIVAQQARTRPALASICKLCHWRTSCTEDLQRSDDLSLIPELGRARRDAMFPHLQNVSELAQFDINSLVRGSKTIIPGVGLDTLARFQERAQLQKVANSQPYLRKHLELPEATTELFFDIEADPMRHDICYLHGFLERRDRDVKSEKYVPFLAKMPTEDQEKEVFARAFEHIRSRAPCVMYYYSKYERTWWRKLQKRYPMVARENDIEAIFEKTTAVDLFYDVVQPFTVWPTHDHSIKTLASYLGFNWRDPSPSGADSIEWYHRWVDSSDEAIRRRILEYNEDDCRATRVLLDGLRNFRVLGDR